MNKLVCYKGKMETWVAVDNLERLARPQAFSFARWRKDWIKMSVKLAQDRVASLRSIA